MAESHKEIATRVLKSAERRAPSFILVRLIFEREMDLENMTDDDRAAVWAEAKKLMESSKNGVLK